MKKFALTSVPVLALTLASCAHGQFFRSALKGGDIAVGGTGQFSEIVTQQNNGGGVFTVTRPDGGLINETVTNNQQFTTSSAGFLGSMAFHPVAWAGIEVNYGYTHYSERYSFNYSSTAATQTVSVPLDMHEATAAYIFHPKHIRYQPFLNVGGGGIDFAPRGTVNQWRTTGLVETGFDIPTSNKHLAFRVQGRALIYRSPNFTNSLISTRSWRVTSEPGFSAVYRF